MVILALQGLCPCFEIISHRGGDIYRKKCTGRFASSGRSGAPGARGLRRARPLSARIPDRQPTLVDKTYFLCNFSTLLRPKTELRGARPRYRSCCGCSPAHFATWPLYKTDLASVQEYRPRQNDLPVCITPVYQRAGIHTLSLKATGAL